MAQHSPGAIEIQRVCGGQRKNGRGRPLFAEVLEMEYKSDSKSDAQWD